MSIPSSNPQTFGWIKSAISQSMLQAMESVALAEQSTDKLPLEVVAKNLHQVQGSLQMVELDAASMFAGDLETLTDQLAKTTNHEVFENPSNSITVLKNGLKSLKKYLTAIENQIPQSPLVLVDDINAVRTITGGEKITNYDLFDPPLELSAYSAEEKILDFPEDKLRNVLFNLRKRYRKALLSWLNHTNRDQSLTTMVEMITHVQKVSGLDILQQLWWVAAGFVESVKSGDIKEGPEVKAQFAKLSTEMGRMSESNRSSIASSPPDELLRQMLFYIGDAVVGNASSDRARNEIPARVSQINEQLGLGQWFTFEAEVQQQDEFSELVKSITEFSVAYDVSNLEQIENNIDLYFSGDLAAEQIENLFVSLDQLKELSGQFDIEGLNNFIDVLAEAIKSTEPDTSILVQTGADIKIASALLLLKDSLLSPSNVSEQWKQSVEDRATELAGLAESVLTGQSVAIRSRQQAEVEFVHAKTDVIDEISSQLTAIEGMISNIGNSDFDQENFELISGHLDEIASWFEMLNGDQIADLVRSCARKFAQLQTASLNTDREDEESIAFVIASISVCAEQFGQANNQPSGIIERAQKMLDSLGPVDSGKDSEELEVMADAVENEGHDQEIYTVSGPETDAEAVELNEANFSEPIELDIGGEVISFVDASGESPVTDAIDSDVVDQGELAETEQDFLEIVDEEAESVESLLENLDSIRRNIKESGNHNVDDIRLSLVFNALEDSSASHKNKDSVKLVSIGKRLAQKLVNREIVFDSEVEDFVGLISRQLRELEGNQGDQTKLVLTEWEEKLNSIINRKTVDNLQQDDTNQETVELQVVDETLESGAFDDPELRNIFIDELNQHAETLEEASQAIKDDFENSDSEDDNNQIRSRNLEIITRVIHTLTGNFKNLGLNSIGDCFDEIGSSIKLDTLDTDINQRYFDELQNLYQLLIDSADEIREHRSISIAIINRYREIANVFDQLQLQVTKNSIPFDPSGVVEPAEETRSELDFSILEFDDEQEFEILEDEKNDLGLPVIGDDSQETETVSESEPESEDESGPKPEIAESDDLSEELKKIFLEESRSRLSTINSLLSEWRLNGVNEEILGGIRREFHTLKGSAAAMGFDQISRLSHVVESLLQQGDSHSVSDDSSLLNLLEEMHDGLASELGFIPGAGKDHLKSLISMVELLLNSDSVASVEEAVRSLDQLQHGSDDESGLTGSGESDLVKLISEQHAASRELESEQGRVKQTHGAGTRNWVPPTDLESVRRNYETTESSAGSLRIENRKLTDLLNFSGELGLTRTQLKTTLDDTKAELDTLRNSMKLVRDGLRDLEFEADSQMRSLPETSEQALGDESFDPLQLDRYSRLQAKARDVSHQLDSLTKVERQLSDRTSELSGTLIQQLHLGEQLQGGLMSARMVSINDYMPRLRQLVRDTSRRLNKSAEFTVEGGDIEVDRQVMEMMMPPFEHMVRNALIHGIESEQLRSERNKPASGTIQLNVVQQGSELLINFSDDGQGMDREKLSLHALEIGLVENIEEVTEEHLLQIISQPGYTTAESVSLASGRGVGMDVVYQAVRSLGGSMALSSPPGQGASFQFRLPVTLTISQALLVKVGTFRFAIITRMIERVMRVHDDELEMINGQQHVAVGENRIPVVNLASQLGEVSLSTEESYRSLILIRLADRIAAFEVDQFEETVEVVTKTPGSQLTSIDGVIGVTVLADTSIVLILDPGQFVDRTMLQSEVIPSFVTTDFDDSSIVDIDVSTILQRVLVVDDSLVVRKVMQRDIEGFGLEAVLAVDGINALEILEQTAVDFVLIDLEMPRMNGYELIVKLREDPRFENLPIIVITSRSGEMHRQRAIGLGADEYITKPYDDMKLKDMMEAVSLSKIVKH